MRARRQGSSVSVTPDYVPGDRGSPHSRFMCGEIVEIVLENRATDHTLFPETSHTPLVSYPYFPRVFFVLP